MELIDRILVSGKEIQILSGNLSEIPTEHKVDILVGSAFPNDYHALPGSLLLSRSRK